MNFTTVKYHQIRCLKSLPLASHKLVSEKYDVHSGLWETTLAVFVREFGAMHSLQQ